MSDADRHLMSVFTASRDRTPGPDRLAYLDLACAGDPALRAEVETLLRAHDEAGGFLEPPEHLRPTATSGDSAASTAFEVADPEEGTLVAGRYRLLEGIGMGGMGAVWRAEQTEPVRREVALKLIRAGMDSKQVLARFEGERQALARMDHPNIARVFDGGATADGRPYFVMELVRGVTITAYCDRRRLTVRRRLELFAAVCDAVQHAHQKGVVHRDIKPANVLVGEVDGVPVPKVIDFGIAKATGEPLTDESLVTGVCVVGTPEYMSPEQAAPTNQDIDTRSDVYSLGALLYELLAGATPLAVRRSARTPLFEVLRRVREEEPAKPSARLSALADAATVAADRGLEPRKLCRLLRGELDWVVMRALEKDRSRRYQTAAAFATDARNYLEERPVLAGPPSRWYQFRKFARRNRGGVIAAGLVFSALLAGIAGTSVGLLRANRERDDKDLALRAEQRVGYYRLVALAHRELGANSVGRAEQLLAECPDHLCGWEWHYLKRLRYGGAAPLEGHADLLRDVAISADGGLIYSASNDHTVKAWDAATGRCLRTLTGHTAAVGGVALAPGGARLATAGEDSTVRVWDAATGSELLRIDCQGALAVAFSPDGRLLAAGGRDGTVTLWDAATGRAIRALGGHTKWIEQVAFSPDGRRLASSSADKTVRVRDVETGEPVLVLADAREGATGVSFSPDGLRLAVGSLDARVRVYDPSTGEVVRVLVHDTAVYGVAFSPDGRRLATAGFDRTVRLWDPDAGQEILALREHADTVYAVAFSRDGNRLVSAGTDGAVYLWDATPLGERHPFEVRTLPHDDHVMAAAFSRDGRYVASGGADQVVTLWDCGDGRALRTFRGHTGAILDLAFRPDGRQIASASLDFSARVWDTEAGGLLFTLRHDRPVAAVGYSPDGRRVVTASNDHTVASWDSATGARLSKYTAQHSLRAAALSPDGGRVAFGGFSDFSVRVIGAADGREVPFSPLVGHTKLVQDLAWSPDGSRLASASFDSTARVWDATTGREVRVLRGHKERVWCLAWSPDGQFLATGSLDGTVVVWHAATGQPLRTLRGHLGVVWCVTFSPDGSQLATGSGYSGRGELKIWSSKAWAEDPDRPQAD